MLRADGAGPPSVPQHHRNPGGRESRYTFFGGDDDDDVHDVEEMTVQVGFSIPMAHRMIAGCDALLMPSRFEPCGLNQVGQADTRSVSTA